MDSPSHVEILRLESRALQDNPLADPTLREIPVYLPPGYEQEDRRYPVLYVLTGFTGFGRALLNRGAWDESLDQRLDRLVAAGMPKAIVVMPDCLTRYGGSQYMNSSATGAYEDHFLGELLPTIDQRFRTLPTREGRGVLGKSSGGYGALRMALLHADRFAAAACHSGDLYFELCYKPDFPRFLNAVGRAGGVEEFLQQFAARKKLGTNEILAMNILAMAACYSPNPSSPTCGIDFPFDLHSGELQEEVWQRWLQQDPIHLVEEHAEALRSLSLLFVDCGTRDEFHLHFGARIFAQRCRDLEIPLVHEEFDDNHRGISYRYDHSIPRLIEALSTD
jgi:enterochelin esterase family protein